MKKPEIVAIIPARGGSKGIPRKNIRDLCGKPLVAYSIEVALKAKKIDRVIVSTDDEEIAEISRSFGAEVPFLRPPELAVDSTTTIDVLVHLVETLKSLDNLKFTHLTLLQPTSPLRNAKNIEHAIGFLEKNTGSANREKLGQLPSCCP